MIKLQFPPLAFNIVLLVATGFAVCLCCNQIQKYTSFKKWQSAHQARESGNFALAISLMDSIGEKLQQNGEFMFEFGQTLTLEKKYVKAIDVLEYASTLTSDPYLYNSLGNCYQQTKNYAEAKRCYQYAFFLMPHKFYPRYLLIKLYLENMQKEKAIAEYEEFMKMKIKINSTAIDEMKTELSKLMERQNEKNCPIP